MRLPKNFLRYLLGLIFLGVLLGHTGHLYQIPVLSHQDAFFYDVRVRMTMPGGIDDRVVIVDLDEKSLAEIGRWPWGRDQMATLVERLFDHYFVATVGFDVVFAEPDESSGLKTLERLSEAGLNRIPGFMKEIETLRPSLDYDQRFAKAMAGRSVVLGYYFSSDNALQTGALPSPSLDAAQLQGKSHLLTRWSGFGGNLPMFVDNAARAGHFNPLVDFDGVSRRVLMLVEHDGRFYESLSLAMMRQLLGRTEVRPGFVETSSSDYAGLEWIDIVSAQGTVRIPVDAYAGAMIPFRGPRKSFPYVSAADVIHGRAPVEDLAGRVVIVGTTAPGLLDLRSTPVESVYPGVEVHANMVTGMIDGTLKSRPSYLIGVETVIVLLFGLLLTFVMPRLTPGKITVLALVVSGVFVAIAQGLWEMALVLPVAAMLWLVTGLYILNMAWGFFVESRVKRQVSSLFGQYVPPQLVDEMVKDPERYSMEGRNEELTVLFSDVRNFTGISEGLNPKELTHLMNEYLGEMTTVIRDHRGTLDKYIGDAIMAFWGAPVGDPEHPRHAVQCALRMQQAVRDLAEPFTARGWPPLSIGIGINTGVMTVGDMGSPVRKAYTVMGDAVNLASRLEGLSKQYGVCIVIGESTRAAIPEIACRELDRVRVKGKEQPVVIYEPIGPAGNLTVDERERLDQWARLIQAYHTQDWVTATACLNREAEDKRDRLLYDLYRERVAYLRDNPPGPDWDGVTTWTTK